MRTEFTAKTKEKAYTRSFGLCEAARLQNGTIPGEFLVCGSFLGEGNIFFEHIIQCEIGGDNSLDNCACLCKTHWRWKTAKRDLPVIAKTKRQARGARGIRKPSTFSCSRTSPFKKRIDGTVVRR